MAKNVVGNAAQDEPPQAGPPVGCHDDDRGVAFLRDGNDAIRRVIVGDCRRHAETICL